MRACTCCAGEKSHLAWTHHYLACVVQRGPQRSLQILDLRSKLIAFTLPLTQVGLLHGPTCQGG